MSSSACNRVKEVKRDYLHDIEGLDDDEMSIRDKCKIGSSCLFCLGALMSSWGSCELSKNGIEKLSYKGINDRTKM